MAVILLRGIAGTDYSPPPPSATPVFTDIDGHWAQAWIENLFVEGITVGYPDGTYRPNNSVLRSEMAVFLVRTFNLAGP
jgi:hypothetical protein